MTENKSKPKGGHRPKNTRFAKGHKPLEGLHPDAQAEIRKHFPVEGITTTRAERQEFVKNQLKKRGKNRKTQLQHYYFDENWPMQRKYREFCRLLRLNRFDSEKTCARAHIKPDTYKRWRRDPDFQEELKAVTQFEADTWFAKGLALIDGWDEEEHGVKPDSATLARYQAAIDPRFKKTSEVHVSGEVNHRHEAVLAKMSPDEKMDELRRYLSDDEIELLQAEDGSYELQEED